MVPEKSKILVLVEGQKTDYKLMQHLLRIYGIGESHEIVSYNTNIYTLYQEMFSDGDPASIDILQNLKEHEKDPDKKKLFDARYSDILLIFDMDPQDPQFSPEKLSQMLAYFVESSDMGKLYLNYPMVEAFYHMKSIPDTAYHDYVVSLDELQHRAYKKRVSQENRDHDYRKFAVTKDECNTVIGQNIEKAWRLTDPGHENQNLPPDSFDILCAQLQLLSTQQLVSVLCTCTFYIADYNPELLK
jgi:hypothetical protein